MCDYISKRINQEFFVDDEEVLGDIEVIITRLENETEYSLLPLASGDDTTDVLVVKKSDKPRLVELADELGLEVS